MPLPTFVIVGAQKCGTSTLSATLRLHPQVFMSRPKELHFFDRRYDQGLEWYSEQFKPRRRHLAAGEASPSYLYDDDAPERIAESLSDTKLIVMLRDPAKRAYSHYWHTQRLGAETVDFETALATESERIDSDKPSDRSRYSYVDRGHYLPQVQNLASLVGRDRLHVVLLDDLADDRVASLRRVFDFLGIDTARADTIEEKWTNKYRVQKTPGDKAEPVAYPPMKPETRAQLVKHFRPHNDRLAAWLGRDLSAWNVP